MEILEFKNLPDKSTPINSTNLNKVQQNVKDVFDGNVAMGSILVDDVSCKNKLSLYNITDFNTNSTYNNATDISNIMTWKQVYNNHTSLLNCHDNYLRCKKLVSYDTHTAITFKNLKPNTTYTLSCIIHVLNWVGVTGFQLFTLNPKKVSFIDDKLEFSTNFTTNENGVSGSLYSNYITESDGTTTTGFEYELLDFMIEEGDKKTNFIPHKKYGYNSQESMGNIVVDDVSCKNLYYIQSLDKYTYNATGGIVSTSGNIANTTIYVTDFSKITFSWKSINSTPSIRILEYNSSGGFIQRQNVQPYEVNSPQTVELHNSTSYFIVSVEHNDIDMVIDLQIEKGTQATEYTPHKKFGYEDTDWINATLLHDWQHVGGNYNKVQYRKVGNIVYIRGVILKNRAMTSNDDRAVFNLPEKFRPKNNNYGIHNGDVYNITLTGDVMFGDHINYTSGSWLSLDGLYFFVD